MDNTYRLAIIDEIKLKVHIFDWNGEDTRGHVACLGFHGFVHRIIIQARDERLGSVVDLGGSKSWDFVCRTMESHIPT
jgi:hypothetical protein